MKERNTEITIFRSKNPEELVVYHACSLKDEIRFYINETHYISAKEKDEESISIELKEEMEKEKIKSNTKLDKKDYLKLFLICTLMVVVTVGIMVTALLIGTYFNSMLMYLIMLNTLMFAFDVVRVIVLEYKVTPPSLKSKHSAEHMMVNFLEKNRRLPKSMSEIKSCSRFCDKCGSRYLIKKIAEDFISKIYASVLTVLVSRVYLTFFSNAIVYLIVFIMTYFCGIIFLQLLLKNSKTLNSFTKPIKKILTTIAQCANTTKKVEEDDIYLAYLAAREWIKIVYPEYYKKEEDVFIESLSN